MTNGRERREDARPARWTCRLGVSMVVALLVGCTSAGDDDAGADGGRNGGDVTSAAPAVTTEDDTTNDGEDDDTSDGCLALEEMATGVEAVVDDLLQDELEPDPGTSDEPTSVSLYRDLLELYEGIAAETPEDQQARLRVERLRPLQRMVDADPDGEGIPPAETADDFMVQEPSWRLALWQLLPNGVDSPCPDDRVQPAHTFAAPRGPWDGQPRFDLDRAAAAYAHPELSVREAGTIEDGIRRLFERAFGLQLAVGALDGVEDRFFHAYRTSRDLVEGRWVYVMRAGEEEPRDPAGQVVEVEVGAGVTWLDRRLPPDVTPGDDGVASFTTDDSLYLSDPLEPGSLQRVTLIHDPTIPFGVAVSLPVDSPVDDRDLLDEILVVLDLTPVDP